ncbi:nitrogenase component 1 [Dorea sp.]
MKGLRKYLTPFAPDQSGAVSVLYELGGMLVICDAGGCTGNVCGFDEPRWFEMRSAVFSAGLRDMDAILGRDDRLVAKLADACEKLDVTFAAVIGTPVPAVIGTDYRALDRMLQKKTDLPVLTVNTDGMELYDKGEEKAYLALFQKFADAVSSEKNDLETEEKETDHQDAADEKTDIRNVSEDIEEKRIGIIGMTPQDVSDLNAADKIRKLYKEQGIRAVCYGMGDGLEEVQRAGSVVKNIVVSPAALKAAQYLEKKFGTPYEVTYPLAAELVPELEYNGKKILIVQQQVIAKAVREEIVRRIEAFPDAGGKAQAERTADITTATWFMIKKECERTGVGERENLQIKETISLKEEEDFINLVEKENYDMIFADPCMEKMIPEYEGTFIPLTHFAVSGKLNKHESVCEEKAAEKKR